MKHADGVRAVIDTGNGQFQASYVEQTDKNQTSAEPDRRSTPHPHPLAPDPDPSLVNTRQSGYPVGYFIFIILNRYTTFESIYYHYL
ncbi:MAG: hypothetical protein KGZ67_06045 [Hydrogenophaga sp.]|jgi:hypothetical protein|nr:hypothetical protein [Hydrogenophaga sp.]